MDSPIIEVKYPIKFREADAKVLGEHIRLRHNVDLVGVKRVGIGDFLNFFLYHKDIVKKYFEKDIVERAFKKIKGILNLRPIRVWLKEHVEGHVRICYLAYAILSFMNYKLRKIGVSAIEALDSLKTGYKVELYDEMNKHNWSLTVELEPKQRKILKAIGVVYKD